MVNGPLGDVVEGALGGAAVVIWFCRRRIKYITLEGHLGPSPVVQQKMIWTAPNAWRC